MRNPKSAIGVVGLGLASLVSPLRAQVRHPDFSGVWTMDTARSEKSTFNPAGMTYRVAQHGDTLIVDRESTNTAGVMTPTHTVLGFDGRGWKNTLRLVGQETETTSTLSWAGDTLIIRATSEPGGKTLSQVDHWTLSADHATLMMKREATYDGGAIGAPTWVFVRR